MRACSTCGNEIPEQATRCPFCDSPQMPSGGGGRRRRRGVATVNLEAGRPTVPEALARLRSELTAHRTLGTRVLRLIHGWGSSGVGGGIRAAVRRELADLRTRGLVRTFVRGEDYSEATGPGADLLARHPVLRSDLRTDRQNPGITLVET